MHRLKLLVGLGILFVGSLFAATPQVKNVNAFQQYPWGAVCISYEVEGDVASSAEKKGRTPGLRVKASDKASGKTYEAAWLYGDTGYEAGLHRIVWDIGAQGISLDSKNVVFTVMYCDVLYLVVDLSAGASASSYPVSYLDGVPSGGWTDAYKTTKLVLRYIPAGTYKMQNTSNVTLTKPFYIGVFEVTQRQWELVMGSNPCSSTSYGKGDSYPVHWVSYNMIRGSADGAQWPSSSAVGSTSFMGKLRARTGINFDLPMEAQWEYACRAGTTTTYYWGGSMNGNYAWYNNNSSSRNHVVGTKTPNAWGLYDMSGNVWEWCLDWHGTLAYGTDPKGPASGSHRVTRGGSWNSVVGDCTSSYRSYSGLSYEDYNLGFRLVRTLSN